MMTDKQCVNKNKTTEWGQVYSIIKRNTAQIAIAVPIVAGLFSILSEYYFYLANYGYYQYFGIDDEYMLPYNKVNFFENIGQIVLSLFYWGYSIFAVRMILIKKNYIWKFISLIIIPMCINGMIIFDNVRGVWLVVFSAILLLFQWMMIFALGYCMVSSFHKELINERKREKFSKKKKQK